MTSTSQSPPTSVPPAHRLDAALRALSAAASARKLYSADHPSAVAALSRAIVEFSAALESTPQLQAHAIDNRVIGPSGTLPSSDTILPLLFAPLLKAKKTSIRFRKGVRPADLSALIDALNTEPALIAQRLTELPQSFIETGTFQSAGDAHADASALSAAVLPRKSAAELASTFQTAWLPAISGPAVDAKPMENVAAGICAALVGARGTMLELAELKHHDEYSFVHTVNVALLAAALAETCGLSTDRVHSITLAALMHDIGKRVIPLEVLNKRAALNDAERIIMNRHPVEGGRLLIGAPGLPDIAVIVAFEHHMHIDGTGYPKRPKSWSPNLAAQIVQQADVFDALRTNRPYRAAMSAAEACAILRQGAGTRYDAALVDVFIQRVVARTAVATSPAAAA